ncbi:hypothetical protein CR513_31623, partial [Mucuna pruriens]
MARTKIDVHAGTFSMEFGDTFVKFNIFEALKHPAEDHSIFSIDAIDRLVEGYFQIGIGNANLVNFVDIFYVINKFYTEVTKFPVACTSKLEVTGVATLINTEFEFEIKCWKANWAESYSKRERKVETDSNVQELAETNSNVQELAETNSDNPEEVETVSNNQSETRSDLNKKESQQVEAESDSRQSSLLSDRVGQPTPSTQGNVPPQPQTTKLNSLLEHLKEQEEKLLKVLRKHKKATGWTLADLPKPLHLHAQNLIGGGCLTG